MGIIINETKFRRSHKTRIKLTETSILAKEAVIFQNNKKKIHDLTFYKDILSKHLDSDSQGWNGLLMIESKPHTKRNKIKTQRPSKYDQAPRL